MAIKCTSHTTRPATVLVPAGRPQKCGLKLLGIDGRRGPMKTTHTPFIHSPQNNQIICRSLPTLFPSPNHSFISSDVNPVFGVSRSRHWDCKNGSLTRLSDKLSTAITLQGSGTCYQSHSARGSNSLLDKFTSHGSIGRSPTC